MIPLFYPLIEDKCRHIAKLNSNLLPKGFTPEDRKRICDEERSFTRNKVFIDKCYCLTQDQAKRNVRAVGFKGKELNDRIKASHHFLDQNNHLF